MRSDAVSTHHMLEEYSTQHGWDDEKKIELLCEFVGLCHLEADFEEFLGESIEDS